MLLTISHLCPPPLLLIPTQHVLFILAASTPATSILPYPLLLAIHVLSYNALTSNVPFPWQPDIGALNNALSVAWSLIATDRLIITRWSWIARGPEAYRSQVAPGSVSDKSNGSTRGNRSVQSNGNAVTPESSQQPAIKHPDTFPAFALDLCFNARGIGRPWGIRRVPAFSNALVSQGSPIPTKRAFLLNRTLSIIRCVAILTIVFFLPQFDPVYFAPERIPFLSRLTEVEAMEIPVRAVSMLAQRSITFSLVTLLTDLVSTMTVIMGSSTPAAWPPQFGSPLEAYTVRRYWGNFWHQLLRPNLEHNSNFFTDNVLGLPKRTLISRYIKTYIAFFLSGYVHLASDIGVGVPFALSGSLRYYGMQALGIFIEDAVQQAVPRSWHGLWVGRGVGYLWVVAWLAWSGPCWVYPQMYAKAIKNASVL